MVFAQLQIVKRTDHFGTRVLAKRTKHLYINRMNNRAIKTLSVTFVILLTSTLQVSISNAADNNVNSLVKRLNARQSLWQINAVASSPIGAQARQRLGLFQQPSSIIECNLPYSGTWLFVYKSTDQGYKAAGSNYFVRSSAYAVEILIDPKTNYIVLLHTSMGGNEKCLNSAYKVLSHITD